jgi:uncharacterized protein DUF222
VSGLRSALEEFSDDPSELPDARLEEDFAELTWAAEALEAKRLRLLGQIDRRQPFRLDGFLSTVSWLAARYKMSWSAARVLARTARALEGMPRTAKAFGSGEISSSALRVLTEARGAHPEAFGEHEPVLIEAAKRHSAGELRRVVAYWQQALDLEEARGEPDRLLERRHLHVSPLLGGMVRVDGDLDPETGETLLTALRAVEDAEARSAGRAWSGAERGSGWHDEARSGPHGETAAPDRRTPAQRRADALRRCAVSG